MAVRAENDPRFSRRFLFMGIAALGYSMWSLYDGVIKYPREQERALAWEKLYDEGRSEEWEAYASERGWSASTPEKSKTDEEHRGSLWMQYAQFVVAGLLGLWLISIPLRARGRWIESSDTGITSSWGQSVNFSDVVNLNKRQWRSKGIARITYLDRGRKKRFILDDYKFDRYKTDAILYEVEQRIDPSLISGGPLESPPGETSADTASSPSNIAGEGSETRG